MRCMSLQQEQSEACCCEALLVVHYVQCHVHCAQHCVVYTMYVLLCKALPLLLLACMLPSAQLCKLQMRLLQPSCFESGSFSQKKAF